MEATQPSVAEVPQPSSGVARYGARAQGSQQLELEGHRLCSMETFISMSFHCSRPLGTDRRATGDVQGCMRTVPAQSCPRGTAVPGLSIKEIWVQVSPAIDRLCDLTQTT